MICESINIQTEDLYSLDVHVFLCDNPKGVIKIIHGMEEHQNRYIEFAQYLQENGFIVVTADLRGHGRTAPKLSHISNKFGEKLLIRDEECIIKYINDRFPGLPITILGHSMGAIIARVLLQNNSQKFNKVILTGYPNYNKATPAAIVLAKLIQAFKGPDSYSKTLTNASLGAYSKAIANHKTNLDWLSYNEDNVDSYIKDPLCGEEFTISSYLALFKLVKSMHQQTKFINVNKTLPILLASGIDDPCTGGNEGRKDSLDILRKSGFVNITEKIFDNMRHEILNENDRQNVYHYLLNFLNK